MSEVGHNSVSSVAADELRQFVERIERMDEEIEGLNSDKKDIYAEAKGRGFDTKAMKIIIQRRAKDASTLQEEDAMVELYERALGMAASRPSAPAPKKRSVSSDEPTMTMSYTDEKGETVTTEKFSQSDLERAAVNAELSARGLKRKKAAPQKAAEDPPPARAPARESDDVDPFEGF